MILDPNFVASYSNKPVPWGFNGLGYIVMKRTYARQVDGEDRKEEWYEVVERCVNGAQEIGAEYTEDEAKRLFDYVFNLKGSFSGRALWQLGTPLVKKFSGASLINCWMKNIETIDDFNFIFDMLALGGGVGYSVERSKIHELPKVHPNVKITHLRTNDADIIVPDSREGWSRLLHSVLKSYFYTGKSFTYSTILIRDFGAPLKTFGGTASGAGALISGITDICKVLEARSGKKIRSIDALDIANLIGRIVCAGSSRRCLPEGTLVHTVKGLMPIEKLSSGDIIDTVKGQAPITNVFDQGVQETININHRYGTLECTPNHKVAVFDSLSSWIFKEAQDLVLGDRLVWDGLGCDGIEQSLPDYVYNEYIKVEEDYFHHRTGESPNRGGAKYVGKTICSIEKCDRYAIAKGWCSIHWQRWKLHGDPLYVLNRSSTILIPKLDEDVAWLIGLIHGDGYVNFKPTQFGGEGYLSISGDEDQFKIMEKAENVLKRFGVETSEWTTKKERTIGVRVTSNELARYLYKHVKQAKVPLEVPFWILNANKEIRQAYVGGIFDADGSCRTRPLEVACSIYPHYLQDVQKVLTSLGITSSFYRGRLATGKWKALYKLTVTGVESVLRFEALIAPNSIKYEYWETYRHKYTFTFPNKMVRSEFKGKWIHNGNLSTSRITQNTGLDFPALPIEVESISAGRLVHTYDIEVQDINQFTANGLVVHNSAQLSAGDPDDYLFLRAKNWDKGNIPPWRVHSNNSIYADSYDEIIDEFWKGYDGSGEPYGLLNRHLAQTQGRLGEFKNDEVDGTNPCFRGDTLIAVADGRGAVPIKQLAQEGKDVPVYSLNPEGRVEIKWGLHPRLTGKNSAMVEVVLDSGKSLFVTPDHKFLLKNGTEKTASELENGDSLPRFTKYADKMVNIKKSKSYLQVKTDIFDNTKETFEHKLIAKFYWPHEWNSLYDESKVNGWHKGGIVVHHKDFNGLNNSPGNLTLMTFRDHQQLHAKYANMSGSNNPRWGCVVSEETRRKISDANRGKSRNKGRKVSAEMKSKLSASMKQRWAAGDFDNKPYRVSEPPVTKKCEWCKNNFIVPCYYREQCFCTALCANHWKHYSSESMYSMNMRALYHKKCFETKEQQAIVFRDLVHTLSRRPWKVEWAEECKRRGISFRLASTTPLKNPTFKTYKELEEYAMAMNHRVIEVRPADREDVYNITVEDNHTVAIVTEELEDGSLKGIYTYQCGEIFLSGKGEACNLASIFLPNVDNYEELVDISKLLYKTQKAITDLSYPYKQSEDIIRKNRRLGQSISGWLQCTSEQLSWVSGCYNELKEFDEIWSDKHEWPRSIALTTSQPSGTLSLIAGITPGLMAGESKFYIRRVTLGAADPLVSYCRRSGYPVEYKLGFDLKEDRDFLIVSFPCMSPPHAILKNDLKAIDQLGWLKRVQTEWADNAVSITVRYGKDELSEIKNWLEENYETSVKSVSFLLKEDHGFTQAPYEAITEAEYNNMIKKIKRIDFIDDFRNDSDLNLECDSGSCPIR